MILAQFAWPTTPLQVCSRTLGAEVPAGTATPASFRTLSSDTSIRSSAAPASALPPAAGAGRPPTIWKAGPLPVGAADTAPGADARPAAEPCSAPGAITSTGQVAERGT